MEQKIKQDVSLGANLRALRRKNNLMQEQVIAVLQQIPLPISREMLSQIERGKYNIRVSVLIALKEVYHVSYEDFFEGLSLSSLVEPTGTDKA